MRELSAEGERRGVQRAAEVRDANLQTSGTESRQASGRSSVFLPQVPVEQGWDLPTYLRELAMKAGLPPDGWKNGRLYRFTAEIVH